VYPAKFEVPAELRELAEKAVDQSEKVFEMFFAAASKSVAAVPTPASDLSTKSLAFIEQSVKATFDHARKMAHANNPQEAMQIQMEFLRNQMTAAGSQWTQIVQTMTAATKEAADKFKPGG
jgi:phasin